KCWTHISGPRHGQGRTGKTRVCRGAGRVNSPHTAATRGTEWGLAVRVLGIGRGVGEKGRLSRWHWGKRGFRGWGKEAVVASVKAVAWFISAPALALWLTVAPGGFGTAGLSSLFGVSRAWSQEIARPMRAHNLLTAAIEAHRRGDYEQAAKLLEQAQ